MLKKYLQRHCSLHKVSVLGGGEHQEAKVSTPFYLKAEVINRKADH